jgi:hypothetical protein
MATGIDALVLETILLRKEQQPEGLAIDAEAHRAQFQLD